MKLRYLTEINEVTKDKIESYSTSNGVTKLTAKRLLEDKKTALQFFDGANWLDVECVTKKRPAGE